MPIAKQAFIPATVIAILIGAAALFGIVGVTLWLVGETQVYTNTLIVARNNRTSAINLRSSLQDAETEQRGYLLTSRPEYLEPYEAARAKISPQTATLHTAVDADPALEPLLAQLDQSIADKLAELQETVDLVRNGQRDAAIAIAIVNADRGKAAMEQARAAFERIITEAERQIDAALKQQQTSINALRIVTLSGAVVILIVMGTYTTIVFGYTRDLITAEKKLQVMNAGLEDRITERTFDLARANEEIQRFAYIVTHDLRAPLVNIMGFTSELDTSLAAVKGYIESADPAEREAAFPAAQAAAAEDLPEAIKFIRSSTRKMDGLINAILALAREGRRKLDPAALDLRALLEAAADSVRHQVIEAGGDIIIEGVAPSLESDRLALDQILGNLLDNAVKYRSDARPIRIHMRMHEGSGGRVVVEVQDNGRGISSQDHERVFELFRRSGRQDKPGEGIGLAHVRALARKLGGNITLVSELDRGSTFTLTIARDLRRVIQGASK